MLFSKSKSTKNESNSQLLYSKLRLLIAVFKEQKYEK